MTTEYMFDYVIVGGGTAGAVIAARLSEDEAVSVCLIEGGPTDVGNPRVLMLRDWFSLLETELDYDYPTVPQERANDHVRHARGKVLGGCSSHNTMISFKPLPVDFDEWAERGCKGWDAATMLPYFGRLKTRISPVAEKDRNPLYRDFIKAAQETLGVPLIEDFNAAPFHDGAGFFSIGYQPETGIRESSSVSYLHPIMGKRANLTVITDTRVMRVLFDGNRRAEAVATRNADGSSGRIAARREIIVSAGSIDSPRLLLLSGVGPAAELSSLGIDIVADVPGVGENLIDHPESLVMWEASREIGPPTVMDFDGGLFVRRTPDLEWPDLMYHFVQVPFPMHTERLGFDTPEHALCMTPNVPKPRSVGRLWLTTSDPDVKPSLDFRYFTDPEGYDEKVIVDGIKIARRMAASAPLAGWIKREVFPGPDATTDEAISELGRNVINSVYHPCGTCRMGATSDSLAVLDPALRVRGVQGLRVADSSILPTMTTVNPVVATLMIGERAADLISGRVAV